MEFRVIPNRGRVPEDGSGIGYLLTDNWNDWYKYRTLYILTYFDEVGNKHDIGQVKIGQFGMKEKQETPDIPEAFEKLDERFFSLGQDAEYYLAVMELGEETAKLFLDALNDIAANENLYKKALIEDVTGESLLRHVNIRTIEEQYRRILKGGVKLSKYIFHYRAPEPIRGDIEPLNLKFEVIPDSRPPTNIHVLIGRNGVGKTRLLNAMTRALVSSEKSEEEDGLFTSVDDIFEETLKSPFANILSITFSAFDDFQIIEQSRNATAGIRYTNVGLRERIKDKNDQWAIITRNPEDLAEEFSVSAKLCSRGTKAVRWRTALKTLETDPLFAEAEVANLVDINDDNFGDSATKLYKRLSSGHKIVLQIITKLVENVEEKTLVLMDEPEAHLHPPLLAAFVRALSNLLINRNGVAIMATHSPVVLQEVPRSCVWKIVRHGFATEASRPEIETFAENVGVLTREIFGHEVTRSGFYKMLAENVEDEQNLNVVLAKFDNEVGAEGRALINSIIASRDADET